MMNHTCMETFLEIVANDLYQKYGRDLSQVAVVFPNRRAGLFFNEYLANKCDQPIWSPGYFSIDELFKELSPYEQGDPVKLVCELYKIFVRETLSEETLDEFYFWGELLISDFNDVDKNLVEADNLFVNLQDLKRIATDFTFLTKEQEEAIQQFFMNFSIEKRTALKDRFISLWDALGGIYRNYKEVLSKQKIAYEGMLYRSAIENLDPDQLPYNKYIFVGFNALTKVERKFFRVLKNVDKALFYWDYDKFYLNIDNHEAGEFIRQNLIEFPCSLPEDHFDNIIVPKNIKYIAASTENAQTRFLPGWIRERITEKEAETAVVLCNEGILLPVLHSIPEEISNVNITMGFPLTQTPVYSFITNLLDLQTIGFRQDSGRFVYKFVIPVLKHAYTRLLSEESIELEKALVTYNRFYPVPSELKRDEFLSIVFTPRSGNLDLCNYLTDILWSVVEIYRKQEDKEDAFNQLYRESLFKAYTTITRFKTLIEEGDLIVNTDTFKRLLYKVLSGMHIPFHGEPAIGLQIMGILETRTLDFKNLILLSANEGKIPKSGGDSSFIPYNLRKAFGMTTIENRNAIYAYYFYRMIQRAENVTILYNTSTDGLNRGEWSRFMLQLLIECPHEITREHLDAGQAPHISEKIVIEKTSSVMKRLQNRFDIRVKPSSQFSPSALNVYLDCQVKFYFHYVVELEPLKEITNEIDSSTFGSIFHYAAELAYKDLTVNGKLIRKEDLETLLKDNIKLKDYVDTAFKELFFNIPKEEKPEYNGVQLINSEVIFSYLKQLLRNDLYYAPFSMEAMEKRIYEYIDIHTRQGSIKAKIGGMIDRLDSKDGILRIVDYKTGGNPKTPANISSLFERTEDRPSYIFQTFLYASILSKQKTDTKVAPALLYIHRAASENYSPVIQIGEPRKQKTPVEDFRIYQEEFREKLQSLLEEIFDTEITFNQTEILRICEYCNFKSMCKR